MNYNVTDKTLAVLPESKNVAKIIDKNKNYNVNSSTFRVIEHSCEYFGFSYRTRVENSQKYIKTKYKTPIVIRDKNHLIFFPVGSPIKNNATWFSYNNIKNYYPAKNNNGTVIRFNNGLVMRIDTSFYTFNQQFMKAARIAAMVKERNN